VHCKAFFVNQTLVNYFVNHSAVYKVLQGQFDGLLHYQAVYKLSSRCHTIFWACRVRSLDFDESPEILIAAQILHGIARAVLLVPGVGDFWPRQIGVFSGFLIILAIALVFVRWPGAGRPAQLLSNPYMRNS
jgi:hypothetical protein